MATDIAAGLGYLAVSLTSAAADVALLLNRERVGRWWSDKFTEQIDQLVAASDRAPRWSRWMYWQGRDPGLRELETRSEIAAFGGGVFWMGAAFMLSILAVLMIVAAVAKFRG